MKKKRILAVDDDNSIREMLKDGLSILGYIVDTAANESDMRSSLEKATPDVVLLDVRMPGKDGINICRSLRSSAQTENIPVIMVTGLADKETMNDAMLFGASAFLRKPFEITEVQNAVEKCIERQNAKKKGKNR